MAGRRRRCWLILPARLFPLFKSARCRRRRKIDVSGLPARLFLATRAGSYWAVKLAIEPAELFSHVVGTKEVAVLLPSFPSALPAEFIIRKQPVQAVGQGEDIAWSNQVSVLAIADIVALAPARGGDDGQADDA